MIGSHEHHNLLELSWSDYLSFFWNPYECGVSHIWNSFKVAWNKLQWWSYYSTEIFLMLVKLVIQGRCSHLQNNSPRGSVFKSRKVEVPSLWKSPVSSSVLLPNHSSCKSQSYLYSALLSFSFPLSSLIHCRTGQHGINEWILFQVTIH